MALYLQDEITQLEQQIAEEDTKRWHNGTFRSDRSQKRKDNMELLRKKLPKYHQYILNHRQLTSIPESNNQQIRNVRNWLDYSGFPIQSKEREFLDREEHLMPTISNTKFPLRRFIEKCNLHKLFVCFRSRSKTRKLYDEEDFELESADYFNEGLINKFVTLLTLLIGMAMLVGPLWWLQHLLADDKAGLTYRLGVITGSIGLFVFLPALLTNAKPFEVLATTAAYAAVLMVFMQLQRQPSS